MSLTRILVPIDFSESSELAARFALALGERHHAEISLLHVDEPPEYVSRMEGRLRADVWEGYLRERSAAVRRQLSQFAKTLPKVPGTSSESIARGDPAEQIETFARAQGHDLVIVAPTGSGSGKHFGTGSVSMHVAAHCPAPVLVFRADPVLASVEGVLFRRPLLVANGTAPTAVAVEWLAMMAAPNADVDVVFRESGAAETPVLPEYEAYLSETALSRKELLTRLLKALKQRGFHAHDRTASGDPASVALETQAARSNDLVIVTRPGLGMNRRQTTVVERIVGHTPAPVLLLPVA